MYCIESWICIKMKNFWQRISWLSQRWRTQRNAIRNVNCRIQWIIESLNAYCALWYSGEHACLSISLPSTSYSFPRESVECWTWVLPCQRGRLEIENWSIPKDETAVIERVYSAFSTCWFPRVARSIPSAHLTMQWNRGLPLIQVSNQVGRPAELKHINKRRKRN